MASLIDELRSSGSKLIGALKGDQITPQTGNNIQESNPMNRINEAKQIIDRAIKLHDGHIADPNTATEESQEELMDLLEQAKTTLES